MSRRQDRPPGPPVGWRPARPRFRLSHVLVAGFTAALSVLVAAAIVPAISVVGFWDALAVALAIAALNAFVPPVVAALRLPFTLLVGFVVVLFADAAMLWLASEILENGFVVESFWWAILAALVASAVSLTLEVVFGADDDDTYTLRVTQRIARRSGERVETEVPGIVFLEIDGLACPVLQRAMRDGSAPNMARWIAEGTHRLAEWETDLSSQTGASQAGILLGSNDEIPAFRWVEKKTATLMTCSAPSDCAEIERRRSVKRGLLVDGGASRGNLLSGGAEHVILTVSRMDAETRANPGYRAFFANGFNVTRTLVLFTWEVMLEFVAAARQRRRDVVPRGHRGGAYPFMRGALCVVVRDLIVHAVLTDMMKGRPAIYATFSSYDEVAHHSGLERADTLEALRKLDAQIGRIDRARRFAPRPYEVVVLSDHGQTQGATFKQRNGYSLEDLVRRHVGSREVEGVGGGDESPALVGLALEEATGPTRKERSGKSDVSGKDVVVLASGNLGLVYLLGQETRLSEEEIRARHPGLLGALIDHPDIGWVMVHSNKRGPVVVGPRGAHSLRTGAVKGDDPLAEFSSSAPRHLLRTSGFSNAPDILVGSFYDPTLEEGCAFEELISFHGGLGGPQTRPFLLARSDLPWPEERVIGAEALHDVLAGWRDHLQTEPRKLVAFPRRPRERVST